MKLNELRIGNLVMSDGYLSKVYHIPDDEDYFEECQPIPLTQEWLIKFGYNCANPRIFSNSDFDGFYLSDINIEYVHQLQNLYFALTGEELTLKENS